MINRTNMIECIISNTPNITTHTFESIFEKIINCSNLKNVTYEYKTIIESESRNYKIKSFPAFFPSVWLRQTDKNELTEDALPNGLIQFDVDKKDNKHFDVEMVKSKLLCIPELYSLFVSPSGGLKFTIKTDFHKHVNDTVETVKERFREAYKITKAYILRYVSTLVFDDSVGTLKFSCFLSYDPNAYLNTECSELSVDHLCYCSERPRESQHTYDTIDLIKIKHLLSFIPKDCCYFERLGINASVINSIGKIGINLLLDHWDTDNKVKIEKDLQYLFEHPLHHNMGYLFNQARHYGYPNAVSGRLRKKLKIQNIIIDSLESGQRVERLKTLNEAQTMIGEAVDRFIQNKNNMIISSSVGIGKSEKVLNILRQIPWNIKAMYVSNNHALLDELKTRFLNIPSYKKWGTTETTIAHIKGKNRLCENERVKGFYGEIPIPKQQCEKDCSFFAECAYTQQFNHISNIRMISSNTLFNEQSYFDNNWKPDIIILDEDCHQLEVFSEGNNSIYQSIRSISLDVRNNISLKDSILNNSEIVITDYLKMKKDIRNTCRDWVDSKHFINEWKEKQRINSEILQCLYNFCITEDETFIRNIRLSGDKLKLSRIKTIHSRFDGIPKLFLDASADEKVIKQLYPNIEFISAHAVKRHNVKFIQAENFNITKSWLVKNNNVQKMIDSCKRYIEKGDFKNIGVVTYKNIDTIKDFDVYLGNKIGAHVVNHFRKYSW